MGSIEDIYFNKNHSAGIIPHRLIGHILISGYKMKKRVGYLRKIIQQIFTGFAEEHSGEMLSLSRKRQILSDDVISATVKDKQYIKTKRAA